MYHNIIQYVRSAFNATMYNRNSFSHWLNFACRFGELTSVFAAALYFFKAVDMSLNLSAMEAVRASSIEDFRAFSFVSRSFAFSSASE